ncbi:protein of unknown function [Candidatus Hydrogenisulfobacillus filiaventi]|uniref:Transglycosylase SLT domain-containing protein n=1 Tax=Candidatus Hydrogenisulfobacillus filiaventi TaxID=2707344 RepID=A0A6F8ZHW0_9FIRM|nr:protein of unknown function [Candidatus Hydrogenisulfobacillus filiaventi]
MGRGGAGSGRRDRRGAVERGGVASGQAGHDGATDVHPLADAAGTAGLTPRPQTAGAGERKGGLLSLVPSPSVVAWDRAAAARWHVPLRLLLAQQWVESRWRPNARRVDGPGSIDRGLAQINSMAHPRVPAVLAYQPAWAAQWEARTMAALYAKWRSWRVALSVYHTGRPDVGLPDAAAYWTDVLRTESAIVVPPPTPPAPPTPPPALASGQAEPVLRCPKPPVWHRIGWKLLSWDRPAAERVQLPIPTRSLGQSAGVCLERGGSPWRRSRMIGGGWMEGVPAGRRPGRRNSPCGGALAVAWRFAIITTWSPLWSPFSARRVRPPAP